MPNPASEKGGFINMMGWYYSTHPEAYKIPLDVGWRGPELSEVNL